MKKIRLTTGLLILSIFLVPLTSFLRVSAEPEPKQQLTVAQGQPAAQQAIIVHLQHGTDDLHAALMALKVANGLREKGAQVTLVLTQEGVRIADTRQSLALRWGMGDMTLGDLYDQFVKAGGKVKVCPLCAEAVGLTANSLRQGAELAEENKDIPNLILLADKILSF
jgi:predicted peroxiredoxin